MIARIRGLVIGYETGSVIVEAGGIGYRIRVPESVLTSITKDDEIILYTELIIRQDLMPVVWFLYS